MTFWRKPEFKALQKAWYQRLKDEGFEDVEEIAHGDQQRLKQSTQGILKRYPKLRDNEEYFIAVAKCVRDAEFKTTEDRLIMTLYSKGRTITKISKFMARWQLKNGRGCIRFTIRRYEMKWGLRTYSPEELNRHWQKHPTK